MRLLTYTKITLILVCLVTSGPLWAQSCTQILNDANTSYSEGDLKFINTSDFQNCFTRSDGFQEAERIEARRLVTLVHIYEDRMDEAEEAMIELLHDDPEHPIDEALDPYEFKYLYSKFRTQPIFRVGVRGGVTRSTMNLIDDFAVNSLATSIDGEEPITGTFTPQIAFQAGVYIDYNVWRDVEISLGVGFAQRTIEYENGLYEGTSTTLGDTLATEGSQFFYGPTQYTDVNTFIDVPLVVKYNFYLGPKIVVYPYAGAIGSLLLSSSRSGTRQGNTVVNPGSIDLKSVGLRETLNLTYTAGLGVKLRNGVDYFTLEVGAGLGANNFVDPNGRYQNSDLLFRLGQVDGNAGLNFLSLQVGYKNHSIILRN